MLRLPQRGGQRPRLLLGERAGPVRFARCGWAAFRGPRTRTLRAKVWSTCATKARKAARRHSPQGRWPAANAVTSSRKNSSVNLPGCSSAVRCQPLNSSRQAIQRLGNVLGEPRGVELEVPETYAEDLGLGMTAQVQVGACGPRLLVPDCLQHPAEW